MIGLILAGLFLIVTIVSTTYFVSEDWKTTLISAIISIFVIFGGITWYLTGTQSGQREIKNFKSDVGNGIERTVYVYDREGDLIKTYKGKFDIEDNENKVLFDINGKRVIIYNATVIVEEK